MPYKDDNVKFKKKKKTKTRGIVSDLITKYFLQNQVKVVTSNRIFSSSTLAWFGLESWEDTAAANFQSRAFSGLIVYTSEDILIKLLNSQHTETEGILTVFRAKSNNMSKLACDVLDRLKINKMSQTALNLDLFSIFLAFSLINSTIYNLCVRSQGCVFEIKVCVRSQGMCPKLGYVSEVRACSPIL